MLLWASGDRKEAVKGLAFCPGLSSSVCRSDSYPDIGPHHNSTSASNNGFVVASWSSGDPDVVPATGAAPGLF